MTQRGMAMGFWSKYKNYTNVLISSFAYLKLYKILILFSVLKISNDYMKILYLIPVNFRVWNFQVQNIIWLKVTFNMPKYNYLQT